MNGNATWLKALRHLFPKDQISTAEGIRKAHSIGESYDQAVMPEVVVYPESSTDVQTTMRFAYAHGIAVTPMAVNSSLEGQTVPIKGGISLDLMRMNQILDFQAKDLLITTEAAVTYPEINAYTRRSGLFFPIDPGAHASIGGMVSTNASGTMAIKYGVTGDYILGLEVVTPQGDIIQTGSKARKSASGYNLNRLYCGAEGTLGVITKVSVRLIGLPVAASAVRMTFPNLYSASSFVTSLIQAGVPVARCELVDAKSIRAVNAFKGTNYPEDITIFLEFHGNSAGVETDATLAKEIASHHQALSFAASSKESERAKLWDARHSMYYACVAANPGKRNVTTDITVPISCLADAINKALTACHNAQLDAYTVGHVGDGNFHLIIFFDEGDEAALERIETVNQQMVVHALEQGGTSTGEHGVGLRKLKYMRAEHGSSLDVMLAVKKTLDPKNIMNPGKKLP